MYERWWKKFKSSNCVYYLICLFVLSHLPSGWNARTRLMPNMVVTLSAVRWRFAPAHTFVHAPPLLYPWYIQPIGNIYSSQSSRVRDLTDWHKRACAVETRPEFSWVVGGSVRPQPSLSSLLFTSLVFFAVAVAEALTLKTSKMAVNTMDAIKKRMQGMKLEKEAALDKADQMEQAVKDWETKHSKVRKSQPIMPLYFSFLKREKKENSLRTLLINIFYCCRYILTKGARNHRAQWKVRYGKLC